MLDSDRVGLMVSRVKGMRCEMVAQHRCGCKRSIGVCCTAAVAYFAVWDAGTLWVRYPARALFSHQSQSSSSSISGFIVLPPITLLGPSAYAYGVSSWTIAAAAVGTTQTSWSGSCYASEILIDYARDDAAASFVPCSAGPSF